MQEKEHDFDPTLFVGAVTTEVQIQNDECYVIIASEKTCHRRLSIKHSCAAWK